MPKKTLMVVFQGLNEQMSVCNATNRELSSVIGIDPSWVSHARSGKPVSAFIAGCIITALETRTFTKFKKGRKAEV